jgi:hypothetical protein
MLIVGSFKKKLRWYHIFIIVATSVVIPFIVAQIVSNSDWSWQGLDNVVLAYKYSIFAEMLLLNIYLIKKIELFKGA